MGELDDAIRDHLELKRRRGADPAEVARQEQEALAPVTRSHPIVSVPPAQPDLHLVRDEDYDRPVDQQAYGEEELDDATQEFRVELRDPHEDWLQDVSEA
jgi:hypothetical protein